MKVSNNILKFFSSDYFVEKMHHKTLAKRPSKEQVEAFTAVLYKELEAAKNTNAQKPVRCLNPKIQRCLDLLISSCIAVPCALAVGISALLTKITNPQKHAFHLQTRVGKDGKEFKVIKIRTVEKLPDGWRMLSNFSRLLRKYSIDEFPQLLNVFKGDMSLVGPRPLMYRDIMQAAKDEGMDFATRRTLLKPGFGFGYEKGRITAVPKTEQEKMFMKNRGIETYGKTIWNLAKTILKGNNL